MIVVRRLGDIKLCHESTPPPPHIHTHIIIVLEKYYIIRISSSKSTLVSRFMGVSYLDIYTSSHFIIKL